MTNGLFFLLFILFPTPVPYTHTQKSLCSFGLFPQPLLSCPERRETSYLLPSSFTPHFLPEAAAKKEPTQARRLYSPSSTVTLKTIHEEWWIKAVRYPWIRVPHLAGIIKYMLNSTQHTSITFDISRNPFLFHSQLMNPEMMATTIAVSFKVLLM